MSNDKMRAAFVARHGEFPKKMTQAKAHQWFDYLDGWKDALAAQAQEAPPPRLAALPRAIGVCLDAESPGRKSVLVAFERKLSDDELRALHDLLSRAQSATPAAPSGYGKYVQRDAAKFADALQDGWIPFHPSDTSALIATLRSIAAAPASAQAAVPEGFYVASFKDGRSNGIVQWWRPDDAGYTPYLEQAGVYTAEQIAQHPGYYDNAYTVPVPVSMIAGHESRLVDQGHARNRAFWDAESLRAAIAAPSTQQGGGE